MAIQVTIGGTDRTERIAAGSIKIENILTRKRDGCVFKINSFGGDSLIPQLGQEVIVTLGGTKVFGGIIVEREIASQAYQSFVWEVICEDYTRLLDRKLVPDTYQDMTVDQVMADLLANYFPAGFTINNVSCPVTVKYIQFNYVPLSRAIEQLADLAGYDWYVDYDKDVHLFLASSQAAPVDIEDANGSHEYDSLVIRADNSQIRNSVVVRGGQYLGLSFTGEAEGNGVDYVFPLPYRFSEFRATLTGQALSIGTDYIDDADNFDALYNFNEKTLKFKTVDTPSNGAVLRYSGLPYLPVIVKVTAEEAISTLSATEGGDGVAEYLIVDNSINSKQGARQRALADLAIYKTTISEGEFVTTTTGFRAGQRVRVNSTSRGIDDYFVVNKVTLAQWSSDAFAYQISLVSTKSFDMIDLLSRLLLADTKKIEIAADEKIDIVKSLEVSLSMQDAISATTSSAGPYVWSNAAGTTPNHGVWGFSTWS